MFVASSIPYGGNGGNGDAEENAGACGERGHFEGETLETNDRVVSRRTSRSGCVWSENIATYSGEFSTIGNMPPIFPNYSLGHNRFDLRVIEARSTYLIRGNDVGGHFATQPHRHDYSVQHQVPVSPSKHDRVPKLVRV